MCGFFPHTNQLSNTIWVPCNSIQFWHYLSGVSVGFHKLRTQSHKIAPISDTNHKFQIVTCTSDWSAINQGFHKSLLSFDNLLEWLTELGNSLITRLPVHYKGIQLRNSQVEQMHRVRYIKGVAKLPCSLWMCHPLKTSTRLATWKLFELLSSEIFMDASSCREDQLLTQSLALLSFMEDVVKVPSF